MAITKISEEINHDRRRFFGTAAMTIAAAQFGMIGSAAAQSSKAKSAALPKIKRGTNTSFSSLKQIDAGLLNVGYAEAGPTDGPAVILLHGWPYDIHSYVDVAPLLASAGYRVIVPYVRGYGTTRFVSSETIRNGQPSAIAVDTIALMDALKIERATLAGFDWGARTANIVAALWPERCKAMVSVSGYLIGSQEAGKMPLPPKAELQCAGASALLKASRNMTVWKNGLPKARSSPCPPLPWKVMPTVPHTPTPVPMPRNSRANTRTGSSREASGTTCLRKPRRPLPKRSSTSQKFDRRQRRDFGIRTYNGEIVAIADAPGPCPRRSTEKCFLRHRAT